LQAVFSVQTLQRLYNEEQLQLGESLETAVRIVGGWCEMAVSLGVSWSNGLVVRQLLASNDVNSETEKPMALEAVTR
jgi:hypothetical protein